MRLALTLVTVLAVSAAASAAEEPQPLSPYEWQQAQKTAFEKSERVYTEALKRTGLLAQFKAMRDAYRSDSNHAFRVVFGQYMSWYQTFVGDYSGAHDAYSIRQLAASDDNTSPMKGGYTSKFDAKDVPWAGNPTADTASPKKIHNNSYENLWKKGGKATVTAKVVVS